MKNLKWLVLLLFAVSCGKTLDLNRVNNIKGPNYPKITARGDISHARGELQRLEQAG